VLVAVTLGSASAAQATSLRFAPASHNDARDVAGGPLDLTEVAFGQQDTRMVLRIRSATAWDPASLSLPVGRSVCLVVSFQTVTTPRRRICVSASAGAPVLRVATLDPATALAGADRPVPAKITRADSSSLEAVFSPLDIDLPTGAFSWRIASSWRDATQCASATACVDVAPDSGPVLAQRRLLVQPRCFGAASRARTPCVSPALRRTVFPTPADSLVAGNAPCSPIPPDPGIYLCTWGASPATATSSVALVGDSHAVAWRGALEVVAQQKRWQGVTMSRAGCPLTMAQIVLPTKEASQGCTIWNGLVQGWFRRHPEVSTVIVSAHNARFKGSAGTGYIRAWRALPDTVKRIYVIRDFPLVGTGATLRCILRAIKHHKEAGTECAQKRSRALHGDAMADAARRVKSGRVRVIDMTHYMCDRRFCYPVVGGALVNKPTAHLTRIFSTSVGPFMLRAIDRSG
jgi:SGNH domain (fused to AT3 domains)